MLIRLLGPIEAVEGSTALRVPGQRCKTLLALLALENGAMISTDRLIDEIWGAQPPPTAQNSLANAIMRIRRVLGSERIVTGAGAYGLKVSPDELDLAQFESLVEQAEGLPFDQRSALLEQALELWRGEMFGGAQSTTAVDDAVMRIEAARFEAQLRLYEARIELGRPVPAAPIRSLIDEQPSNERAWALLGLAINNAGNPRLALDTIRLATDTLRSSGLEPGDHLVTAEQRILLLDPKAKFGPDPAPLPRSMADLNDRRSGRAPLVGRDREVDLLLDRVAAAESGQPSFALVIGEAGIGKSTLVKEILPRAADDRLSWVVCHCGGDGRGPMLELGSGLGIDIKAEEEAAADRRIAGAVGVPGVAGASDGKSYRPQSIGTADSSEMLPHVVERLRSMSKQQPTVLIIEDVHADPYIKPLIGDLLAAVGGHRVLVLATGRPGEIADGLREYARPSIGAGSGVTITVGGLDSREAAEMLGVSGSSDVDALLEATGGNPLYLLTGAAADDGGAGLYDFVRAELAKLAPLSRKLVQLLGVHGGAMSHDELAAASGLGDELSDALHPLLSSGLATERSTRALEIQIRHQTIGEAITDALSGAELIQLHRTIRDTARGSISASPRPNPATLVLAARHAWHATASENVDDKVLAAELCEQAGDAAQDHGEWAQAAELYSRALDCKDATDDERIGRCRLGRAVALFRLGSSDSTDAFIDAAKDASRRADAAMLTDVVLAWDRGIFSQATQVNNERLRLLQRALRNGGLDPDRRARLMAGYASELTFSDRWAERFAIADEALELSETCDVATQAYVLSHRQLTIACLETTDERARSADAFVELANDLRDPHLQFQAKFQRTGPAVLEGDLALLDDLIDEAEDLAQHLSIKLFKWLVHHAKSSLRLLQGDLEQARMLSAEAFALVKGSQHQHEAALVHGEQSCHFSRLGGTLEDLAPMLTKIGGGRENGYTVAALLATAGDLDSAATMLDHDGLDSVDELPRHILERPALQNLAVLADALNRPDLGRDVAVRLQERPRDLGISGVAQPCGHHFAAVALRPSQDWDRLFAHHLAAIAVHDRAHHLLLALEARRELARSMAAAGLVRLDPATLEPAASDSTTSEAGSVIDADDLRKRVNTEAESLGLAGLTVS